MSEEYYEAFLTKTAVPDYTCTKYDNPVFSFHENDESEYLCYCLAQNYMGFPDMEIVYIDFDIFYHLPVDQILFDPILDTTTGTTGCVLGLGGPTKSMVDNLLRNRIVFGQLFFSHNPLRINVDRVTDSYTLSVGNASPTGFRSDVLISFIIVIIALMVYLVYEADQVYSQKKHRAAAQEWMTKNRKKLIEYAELVDSEKSDKIRSYLEQEKKMQKKSI
jgi:hypothetical protein